jgi:hypothetical protein
MVVYKWCADELLLPLRFISLDRYVSFLSPSARKE